MTKKHGYIIRMPKEQATQEEIDQKRVEYIALLVKWKMREMIEEELNIKRQSRVDGSRTRKTNNSKSFNNF